MAPLHHPLAWCVLPLTFNTQATFLYITSHDVVIKLKCCKTFRCNNQLLAICKLFHAGSRSRAACVCVCARKCVRVCVYLLGGWLWAVLHRGRKVLQLRFSPFFSQDFTTGHTLLSKKKIHQLNALNRSTRLDSNVLIQL